MTYIELSYGHSLGGKLTLIRDVPMSECRWLERDFAKGETVHAYTGPTYGCIGPGIACSADGKTPFFELPRDALVRI